MSLASTLFNFVTGILQSTGYAGIFGLMLLESATLPIPSEVVLPWAGYLVYTGTFNFTFALVAASIGSLVGTLIDYWIGYYLGRPAIVRYGKYARLNEKHLVMSENWFKKFGSITVLLARFVPLVRTVVAFPAGIAEMKLWKFIAYSIVGIVIWDAALIYLGYVVGPSVQSIINSLSSDFTILEVLAVIVGIALLYFLIKRSNRSTNEEDTKPEA
ncbi:MAG: DedA family protein [Nitrososphaerales archaeon]